MINGSENMGLFDKVKKTKNAQWTIDRKPTLIQLEKTHIHCESASKDFDIFYKDIKKLKKEIHAIKIETAVEEYKMIPRSIRGASDLSEEMYSELRNRISESKE